MVGDCRKNSALYRICTLLLAEAKRLLPLPKGLGTLPMSQFPRRSLFCRSRDLETDMVDLQMELVLPACNNLNHSLTFPIRCSGACGIWCNEEARAPPPSRPAHSSLQAPVLKRGGIKFRPQY
jgi:hypothetical protein